MKSSLIARLNIMLLACATVLFGLLYLVLSQGLSQRLTVSAQQQLEAHNRSVVELLQAYRANLDRSAKSLHAVWRSNFQGEWTLDQGRLRLAGQPLADGNARADRFTALTGSVATLFAREGDDFRRIATSLKKEDGTRALDTLLGAEHPARGGLLRGETYVGVARLFGLDYMTVYEPIKSARGEVIGVYFMGMDFSAGMADLQLKLSEMRVGQTGRIEVVDAGKLQGRAIVHPRGAGHYPFADAGRVADLTQMLKQKRGLLEYTEGGKGMLAAYSLLDDPKWLVLSTLTSDEVIADARWARNLVLVGCLAVAMVLVLAVYLALRQWLQRPLRQLIGHVQRFSEGDFSHAIEVAPRDEIGQVQNALKAMQQHLSSMLRDLCDNASELRQSAKEINRTAGQIVGSTREQSGATSSVAAAIEQLTVSIGQVAANAQEAHGISSASERVASEGGQVVQQTIEGIASIASTVRTASGSVVQLGSHADAIGGIVNVIREVAEQTNLLALNAAIEAARAGESGRGFAVVADEVRKLAERTQASTTQIAEVVSSIQQGTNEAVRGMGEGVEQVETGMALADQAGNAINRIRGDSDRVVRAVTEINQALRQQSMVAQEVAGNVERIAVMSAQTSQATEESVRVGENLNRLAGRLEQSVARFRLAAHLG